MGAIVGCLWLDAAPRASDCVPRMLGALAHRGSDACEVWTDQAVGLGARADWLSPQAHQTAPLLSSPSGRYTLVADVRLDDREALAQSLGTSASQSDACLLGHALDRWGIDAPTHLLGDFAFAAWDGQSQQIFCARDRMGVRPFYYYHAPGQVFAFASEIRALATLPGFTPRLDDAHLADYLLGTLDHTSTFYRNVRRLQAATTLTVSAQQFRVQASYWVLDVEHELSLSSDDAYAEAFAEVFTRAVRDRLPSLYPVGAALSGGLDSSAIAVVAREQIDEASLHVFSAQFVSVPASVLPLIDERPFVQAVTEKGGFNLHIVDADREGPFSDYERMSWHLEDNFRTINLYMHWALFGNARQAGVRVFLDGLDGDTTVSHGLDRLHDLASGGAWETFAREIQLFAPADLRQQRALAWRYGLPPLMQAVQKGRLFSAFKGAARLRRVSGISGKRLAGAYRAALLPGATQRQTRDEALAAAFIQPQFAHRTGAWERHRAYSHTTAGMMPSERAAHVRDVRAPLCPLMLEMEDRTAAAFGIEPRYPFFDARLIAFCVSLPSDQKMRDGLTRHILRAGMQETLPDLVRLRTTKGNLKPAFDLSLARSAPAEVAPFLFDATPAVANFVDMTALRRAYDLFLSDPLRYSAEATQLYAIATLERGLHRLNLA